LATDRAEGHGAGREAPHDHGGRLDFLERHRRAAVLLRRTDAEERADGEILVLGLVHEARELAVLVARIAAHGVLEGGNRLRPPDMCLAANAKGIVAADIERIPEHRRVAEGVAMA